LISAEYAPDLSTKKKYICGQTVLRFSGESSDLKFCETNVPLEVLPKCKGGQH
jgi:hypothetical protein